MLEITVGKDMKSVAERNSCGRLTEKNLGRNESLPQDGRKGINPAAGVRVGW
jgi:hypothetical protein